MNKPRVYANDKRLLESAQDAINRGESLNEWMRRSMVYYGGSIFMITDLFVLGQNKKSFHGHIEFESERVNDEHVFIRQSLRFNLRKNRSKNDKQNDLPTKGCTCNVYGDGEKYQPCRHYPNGSSYDY